MTEYGIGRDADELEDRLSAGEQLREPGDGLGERLGDEMVEEPVEEPIEDYAEPYADPQEWISSLVAKLERAEQGIGSGPRDALMARIKLAQAYSELGDTVQAAPLAVANVAQARRLFPSSEGMLRQLREFRDAACEAAGWTAAMMREQDEELDAEEPSELVARPEAVGGRVAGFGVPAQGEAVRAEAARVEVARDEAVGIAAVRAEVARDEAARAEAVPAEVARDGAAHAEAVRAEVARGEAAHAETVRAEVARDGAAHAEAVQAGTAQPEAVPAGTAPAEVARDEAARAEPIRAEAARAEAPEDFASEHETPARAGQPTEPESAGAVIHEFVRRAPEPDALQWAAEVQAALTQPAELAIPSPPEPEYAEEVEPALASADLADLSDLADLAAIEEIIKLRYELREAQRTIERLRHVNRKLREALEFDEAQ